MVLSNTVQVMKKQKRTYISLFSSAGVGCFGFKKEGFECIATNELLERRLNIQKINHKCKYDHGYIGGDITLESTQQQVLDEIDFWKKHEGINGVDVLMATPPCQGMSSANYKKGDEIDRNSLVVEAIHLVKKIKPRIFVFENVRAFLTTMCIDKNDDVLPIKECIIKNLGDQYNLFYKVVNFMEYGIPSSRPRTLVIGTSKEEQNFSPLNLFPLKAKKVKTVRDVIGDLSSLNYGERDDNDIYHSFRVYPEYMREWIHDLKEGETAFKNSPDKVPYKLVDGKRQILKSGFMGNKFCRMYWDRPAPCITTRNDQLASQSTIHPSDDRVLSIRELMRVMSIPEDFKWVEIETKEKVDNAETLIRQSIGEAVPTGIILQIAKNINEMLDYDDFIKSYDSSIDYEATGNFYIDSFIFEKKLADVNETGSFYTPQIVVYNTIKDFVPKTDCIRVLEPSVGMGAFLPQFLRLVDECKKVDFDLVDISSECITILKNELKRFLNDRFSFKFICDDFITHKFGRKYDCIITNPPYFKMDAKTKKNYSDYSFLKTDNIYCIFLYKYTELSDEIMCVIPKTFIMIPDSNETRKTYEQSYSVRAIYDYGVKLFKEVFIEILSLHFTKDSNEKTYIENKAFGIYRTVPNGYIYHDKMWLIYRDEWFDNYIKSLELDCFDFYRDRQLTNKYLKNDGKIWVVRSKNLLDDGKFIHKPGYDKYVDSLDGFQLSKFYGRENIIFINFTYNTRATILPKNYTINGSFCILIPKRDRISIDLTLYATEEFRKYYAIVKNLSKFTINVDSNSIYYVGVKKND